VERLTGYYLTIRIQSKTSAGVTDAMALLHNEFSEHFSDVFHTITTDNGSEFSDFSEVEAYGSEVYFAHPYSSWERPVNERSNRLLRRFIPKGKSMRNYSADQVSMIPDEINAMPRTLIFITSKSFSFLMKYNTMPHKKFFTCGGKSCISPCTKGRILVFI